MRQLLPPRPGSAPPEPGARRPVRQHAPCWQHPQPGASSRTEYDTLRSDERRRPGSARARGCISSSPRRSRAPRAWTGRC
eukprot:13554626-Alexandrium_andersonii.AAC.1